MPHLDRAADFVRAAALELYGTCEAAADRRAVEMQANGLASTADQLREQIRDGRSAADTNPGRHFAHWGARIQYRFAQATAAVLFVELGLPVIRKTTPAPAPTWKSSSNCAAASLPSRIYNIAC